MDLRTGQTYDTRAAALAAGVPDSDIAEVRQTAGEEPEVRVTSGPFKGRIYRRTATGLVRVDDGRRSRAYMTKTNSHGEEIRVKA